MKIEDITPINIDAGWEKVGIPKGSTPAILKERIDTLTEHVKEQFREQWKDLYNLEQRDAKKMEIILRQINEVREETQSLRFGVDDLREARNRERNQGIRGWLRRLFGGN